MDLSPLPALLYSSVDAYKTTLTYEDQTALTVDDLPGLGAVSAGLLISRIDSRGGIAVLVGQADRTAEAVQVNTVTGQRVADLAPDASVQEMAEALWAGLLERQAAAQGSTP